ncbi:hypothetical protein DENSPDRAFT_832184 [Dentipellis sp. KUC8613]|nr:hypothetical protein DENSPDRAFT_832184 [Dentipellis sp. KUC8613]
MERQFLGPMPVEEFLKAFVPEAATPCPFKGNAFDGEKKPGVEYETHFAQAIAQANICPDLEFHNTCHQKDTSFVYVYMPDISVIPKRCSDSISTTTEAQGPPQGHRAQTQTPSKRSETEWANLELYIERKKHSQDPFRDPRPSSNRKTHQFVKLSDPAVHSRGQMIAYAGAQLTVQFRCFCFSICLIGENDARLLLWDRGGAVVSERFNYVANPGMLQEFLWRFNHLNLEQRGWDPSVTPATSEEAETAQHLFPAGSPIHKMLITDDADKRDRYFLVSSPTEYGIAVCGRATRGYIALNMETGETIWLKDSWRIDTPQMPKEFKIYAKLGQHHVPNIPECKCGGDVGNQKTRTHEYQGSPWRCGDYPIMPHHHYRLALQVVVGRPLHEYHSTKELCAVILDALIALGEAYSRAGILHRDISGGNILITSEGKGVLIDWDLSKEKTDPDSARQEWRTGTWRFMSRALLTDKPKKSVHELRDDLESIFWLLTYYVLRYQPVVARELPGLNADLTTVFDQNHKGGDGRIYGGKGKKSYLRQGVLDHADLKEVLHPAADGLLHDLRLIFYKLYEDPEDHPEDVAGAKTSLENIDAVRCIFEERLGQQDWPTDDKAVDPLEGKGSESTADVQSIAEAEEDDYEEPEPESTTGSNLGKRSRGAGSTVGRSATSKRSRGEQRSKSHELDKILRSRTFSHSSRTSDTGPAMPLTPGPPSHISQPTGSLASIMEKK